jgi:hypothetical protein
MSTTRTRPSGSTPQAESDLARADAEWGGIPAAPGTSGATWQDLAGDQTGQESRSAGPRAAASVTAMDLTIHWTFKERT